MQDIPGGATGFIVRNYKGKNAAQPFYCYDSALMRDRLALREQLAKELGQWTERVRTDGVKVSVDVDMRREGLKNLTLDELLELERLTAKAMAPAARATTRWQRNTGDGQRAVQFYLVHIRYVQHFRTSSARHRRCFTATS